MVEQLNDQLKNWLNNEITNKNKYKTQPKQQNNWIQIKKFQKKMDDDKDVEDEDGGTENDDADYVIH